MNMEFLSDPYRFIHLWFQDLLVFWGIPEAWRSVISYTIGAFLLAGGAMFMVLFLIWLERKLIGRFQDRFGPNRVGPWGIFQTVADMLKIFIKEFITPSGADRIPYNLAPILSVASVLMVWAVLPFTATLTGTDLNVAVLYVLAVGGLGEMAVVLAGWGSNNKYALLAAFRAVAMLISYEVPLVITMLLPVMWSGSLSLNSIVQAQDVWFIVYAPVAGLIFFIAQLAESGRAPFDLVEAESELVSGFNIEYSGLKFGMFYVADFLHSFTISLLFSTIFLGGWRGPGAEKWTILGLLYLGLKTSVVYFGIILLRASLPRFRIDQMMALNWKLLTPVSLTLVFATAIIDKLVDGSGVIVKAVSLIGLNILVLVLVDLILKKVEKAVSRTVVAPIPRQVSRGVKNQPDVSGPNGG
jgi:NADH-quinone oxidoreductase subunit H